MIGLPGSTYYRRLAPPPAAADPDAALLALIAAVPPAHPAYGYRRVTQALRRQQYVVDHKRVQRVMRAMVAPPGPRRRPWIVAEPETITGAWYPNLRAGVVPTGPNELWVSDINYVRVDRSFVFLLLLDRRARVAGLNDSVAMLAHARTRLAGRQADLRRADLLNPLPFLDACFDGIVSALVLHYLRDWSLPLAQFRRVLRPDGWMLFSAGHPAAEVGHYKPARYLDVQAQDDVIKWAGPVRFYRRPMSRIVNDLSDAGFFIELMEEPEPTDACRSSSRSGTHPAQARVPSSFARDPRA